ncbi:unnamed protein product [Coregonus sp. 'balchen']|nr:unnamed protein product [Coregonus sp. 'balchen']
MAATAAWMHGPSNMRLTEGFVSVLKEQRPEYLPALLANYREHGVFSTQSTGAVGGLVGLSNAKLGNSKTKFEGLCLLSVLVKDSSSDSQAPLPSIQLAVGVLQDLLQYSSQLPELAREVGLNSVLGILTSLLGLKSECHLAAMEGMTACMTFYPRACGSLRVACECYGRLPCLGGVVERGGGGRRAEGWTRPGVELPYPPLDDTDPLLLLQLQHRYRAACLGLKHTLSVDPASAVRLPVQQVLNLVCRALAVSSKSINLTGDGCVRLLVLPAIHKDTLQVLHALITALGSGLVLYSSVLQRLFSQTLAVRVSVYRTLELWVRVGGASAGVLQGSPTHSELLLAHLLGDITPGADSVRPSTSPQLRDLVSSKPCPKSRKPGLAMGDGGGASLQRKGDSLANQDTCLSALRALRQRLHDVVLPLCARLQQQHGATGSDSGAGRVSGQYGSAPPRRELYRLLLALVLVSSFCTEALTICNSLLHPRTPSLSFPLPPLTLKPTPSQASSLTLLGGPTPGTPFPSRHHLGLGHTALLGSLDNHLPLVVPGLSGQGSTPGDLLLSPHQGELAGLGLPEGQRPVFIRYDKEEAEDVEISLESDSDDSVVIVPQGMLMLESQDGTSAAATLPGSSLAPGGVTLPVPGPGGDPGRDISLPLSFSNNLPSTSLPHPLLPSSTINSFPPAPLVSLVPPLNSTSVAQLGEPSVGLGVGADSLPGAQLQQMLLQGQPPAPGQPTALGLPIQMHQNQLAQSSRALQQQQQSIDEDHTVININSSDEEEEDEEMEDEDELGEEEEEEGLEDEEEEGSDFPDEEEYYDEEEFDDYEAEEGEEMEDEEEEGEIRPLDREGRRGEMGGQEEGEVLRGLAEEGGIGGFRVEREGEGGIEELETDRSAYGEEGIKAQEVESIGVLEEEREGEEDDDEGMNDPTMPQILCVTGGALEEREELDREGHGQKVRSWEQKGANRPEGMSSSEEGPAPQHQQEAGPAPEVRVDGDNQPSNQEGETSKQGGDNSGQEMRSSTAPSETKGEGPEREKGGKEGEEGEAEEEDGRGMKRKREGEEEEEEGTGQGTEKNKLDEEAMASMLADFVACPPDNVENVPSASNRPS